MPASFSGDINVAGSAGGPRRPEKMPGRNRAEGIPADGANYGNAGPSGRLPVEMLCGHRLRSEEHTSELQSLMRISYAVFCLKKKKVHITTSDSSETIVLIHNCTNTYIINI